MVTSGGMYGQPLRADDPEYVKDDYSPTTAYARSKRAQVELLPLLQRRWGAENAHVWATHPGWAATPGVAESLPRFNKLTGPILRDARRRGRHHRLAGRRRARAAGRRSLARPSPATDELPAAHPPASRRRRPDVVLGGRADGADPVSWTSHLRRTVPPVVAAAVIGGIGTRPTSALVPRPRQALLAATGVGLRPRVDRALRVDGRRPPPKAMADAPTEADARSIERQLWANMALNAGWCWLFFTAKRPEGGAGRDPRPRGLDARADASRAGRRAVRRVERLRHRAQRRDRPPQPLVLQRAQPTGRPARAASSSSGG